MYPNEITSGLRNAWAHAEVDNYIKSKKAELDKIDRETPEPSDPAEYERQANKLMGHYRTLLDPQFAKDLFQQQVVRFDAYIENIPTPPLPERPPRAQYEPPEVAWDKRWYHEVPFVLWKEWDVEEMERRRKQAWADVAKKNEEADRKYNEEVTEIYRKAIWSWEGGQ